MSMEMWDPFGQAITLRDAMDRLLQDSFFRPSSGTARRIHTQGALLLPLDMTESDDAYTIKASLPGVKPEDIQVQIMGDTVMIRGQTREDHEERRGDQVILHERRAGSFARTATLPTPIDAEHATATFENGELTLRLPKSQQAQPHRVEVQSTNGQQGQQVNVQSSAQGQQQGGQVQ